MNYSRIKYVKVSLLIIVLIISGCRKEKPSISSEEYNATKEHLVEVNKMLVRNDRQQIKEYVERHELNMLESETGLWYDIMDKGKGVQAEEGKTAAIKYKISLLDGKECYSSEAGGIKTFTIGRGGVESGLEEGILMLSAGGKAVFIMPPHLAHGLPGDGTKIPPRAIIVYEVEVLSID